MLEPVLCNLLQKYLMPFLYSTSTLEEISLPQGKNFLPEERWLIISVVLFLTLTKVWPLGMMPLKIASLVMFIYLEFTELL